VGAALALFALAVPAHSHDPPPAEAASSASSAATDAPSDYENFDPASFDERSTVIDNEWMPMKPGMRWVWEGTSVDGDEVLAHRIEIHVTDMTKMIGGVRSLATYDLDFSEDELVEAELAFFAQDKEGTVWRMGEYPEEYEEGKFVAAPTWIHGFEDAVAGIMMMAEPREGGRSYAQGWGPKVDWTDRARVEKMGEIVKVPFAEYDDVLVIDETSKSEPGAHQLKYYARGVGNIAVGWVGDSDPNKETLKLVEFEMMSAEELAEVRAKALALEKHAYEVSKDVYAPTPRMERLSEEMGTD
jgi:hypothetical protein